MGVVFLELYSRFGSSLLSVYGPHSLGPIWTEAPIFLFQETAEEEPSSSGMPLEPVWSSVPQLVAPLSDLLLRYDTGTDNPAFDLLL